MALEDMIATAHVKLLRKLVKALSFGERTPLTITVDGRSKTKVAAGLHSFWEPECDQAGVSHIIRAKVPDVSQIHFVTELATQEPIRMEANVKVAPGITINGIALADMSAGQCVEYITNHTNYSIVTVNATSFVVLRTTIDSAVMRPMKRVVEEPMNVAAFLSKAGIKVSKSRVRSIGEHPTDCFVPAKIKAKAAAIAKQMADLEAEMDEIKMIYGYAKKNPDALSKYQQVCVKEKFASVVGKQTAGVTIGKIELS